MTMKKTIFLTFFSLVCVKYSKIMLIFRLGYLMTFLIFFLTQSNNVFAQKDTTYIQPQWLMPLYFEDGNGEKDTLWIGYHPNATCLGYADADTIFGEKWIEIDTNRFNVCQNQYPGETIQCDQLYSNKILKTQIFGNDCGGITSEILSFPFEISFYKGILPIKISWNPMDFKSNELPFPDISPRPKVRIDLLCGGNCWQHCPWDQVILLTDTLVDEYCWIPNWVFSDSITFINCYPYPNSPGCVLGYINAFVVPHNYSACWASVENHNKEAIEVYPNPFFNEINVNGIVGKYSYSIYNVFGNILKKGVLENSSLIDMGFLKEGVYVFEIYSEKSFYRKILIKTR